MFSKFLSLEPKKRDIIINAAIKEFAQKGYKDASTNEIVKEAGISKGLLFHYFKNKKSLFLFIYDYALELLNNEFYAKVSFDEKDIFQRYRQILLLEYELFKKYPQMYSFFVATVSKDSSEVNDEIGNRYQELVESGSKLLFEGFDVSNYKDGIDVKKSINIIIWSLEGLINKLGYHRTTLFSTNQSQFDEILAEVDVYMELLKKCFYK
ncbi:MAG: TetR/AcrR family transcriptional regulator [Bacillota bacterium]|nr:TetR/AcrR family transcriptional regulator [Bacillota bacterium]